MVLISPVEENISWNKIIGYICDGTECVYEGMRNKWSKIRSILLFVSVEGAKNCPNSSCWNCEVLV